MILLACQPRLGAASMGSVVISFDIEEVLAISDVLIRDIPEKVLSAIDAHAARLGLSRSEYIRRQLSQDAERSASPVTVDDLRRFSVTFEDLSDPDVMAQAWK